LTITLRSGTRWNDGQPEHVEYTAQEIEALVGEFEKLGIGLFKLRHRIEARHAASPPPQPTVVLNKLKNRSGAGQQR